MEQDDPEPHLIDKAFAKGKSNISLDIKDQSRGDKLVQRCKKDEQSVVKVNHDERAVVGGNESPFLSIMEMDATRDEQYAGLSMATDGLRRSGRIKRMRMNSPVEGTGFERAKRANAGGQGKDASTSISSHINQETRGVSKGRTRRTKESSKGKGLKVGGIS
jgi:hypothetical protein